jgi:cytidine deaminase
MNRKIFNYFEIASRLAIEKEDRRSFIFGAIGIRNDGRMVKALNGPTVSPSKQAHAEARLARKLDVGSEVYVARVLIISGDFAMAKPCHNCERILRSVGVKRVYYTIGPGEYGILEF